MLLEDLVTTAQLAMLDVDDVEALQGAFEEMIGFFEQMREVDVEGVEPTTHALAQGNRLRPDEERRDVDPDELLACAPQCDDRFIDIPPVL